eukprot:11075131-Alexandrium_andersonii.AAC.1
MQPCLAQHGRNAWETLPSQVGACSAAMPGVQVAAFQQAVQEGVKMAVSYTHLRAHETSAHL